VYERATSVSTHYYTPKPGAEAIPYYEMQEHAACYRCDEMQMCIEED